MAYTATLKRGCDGKLFTSAMDYEWDKGGGQTDEFWWSEGNFGCDCNRAILAGDPDESCGEERYKVRITLPDGSVPYSEF